MATRPAYRVVLFEEARFVREALKAHLNALPDFNVVAEYETGPFDKSHLCRLEPHLAVIGVGLSERNGLRTRRALRNDVPNVRVVIFIAFLRQTLLHDAMAIAHGYLLKTTPPSEVVAALRRVMAGERVLPPALASLVLGKCDVQRTVAKYDLSPAELPVVNEMAKGASSSQIARTLHLEDGVKTRALPAPWSTTVTHRYTLFAC